MPADRKSGLPAGTACQYETSAGPGQNPQVNLYMYPNRTLAELRKEAATFNARKVPDLGDLAYDAGGILMIKGGTEITFTTYDPRSSVRRASKVELVAVAHKILSRLR